MLIVKSAHDSLLEILFWLTTQQGFSIAKKVEGLISRVASMDALFAIPPGDVAELRRREEVIRYDVVPPSDSVLTLAS